jgi:TonB family protein
MGYQALLFCPDEKTARTVTQVLSELEFSVESCTEPFAAVKKLMSQHFDAVVVDCDNEQNATLLFKSARNSTSNQGSLAVAVVEGQVGVAKAFRIGANLVLTKPINIEQAKGTLRVARGLLRKSEPAKPGAAATAPSPAIPVATKSVPPAKPEAPAAPAGVSPMSLRTRPDVSQAWPAAAAAAGSNGSEQNEDLLDMGGEDSVAAASAAAAVTPASHKFITTAPQADKFLAAAVASPTPDVKPFANPGLPARLVRGAASAPAPARERQDPRVAEALPERSAEADARLKIVEAAQGESSSVVGSAPTFTFGGVNAPSESSGGGKKLLLGIAAATIFAAAAYAGWAHFQARPSQPEAVPGESAPAPVATPQTAKPSAAKPSPAPATTKTSASLPSSQPAELTAKGHTSDSADSASDDADVSSTPSSTKASSSASSATSKTAEAPEATAAPLVVKGGKAPATRAKAGAADVAAPSMIGIATADAGVPLPNFGSGGESAPRPLLQTVNISQGVSRGLLFKKVQPIYPRNALSMRLEGSVELMATISKTGDIAHIKVLSGDSQLTKAAADAVKQWKYKPYLLNGEPVEIQTQVTINFKLPK